MQLAYRGSVNRWECDENDHLNVRFHMEKLWQTAVNGLVDSGICAGKEIANLPSRVDLQHIRFHQEARLAAPLTGYVAGLGGGNVLTELRNSFTDEVVCTAVNRFRDMELDAVESVPDHAAARGIGNSDLPCGEFDLADAKHAGFETIGRGVIQTHECSSNGFLEIHQYMARFSDSMPHLWGAFFDSESVYPRSEGGAVVEYRMRYHEPLRAGDRYELVSGVAEVGAKVQRFAHLLFNLDEGRVFVSAESVGVRIDLTERRAVALSEPTRIKMRSKMLRLEH